MGLIVVVRSTIAYIYLTYLADQVMEPVEVWAIPLYP